MARVARRLTGLVVALVVLVSLPIAAARAGCVCDHGHDTAAAEPHTCTAACTAATCPMHRGAHADERAPLAGDGIGCSCAQEALQLIGHAAPTAIVPEPIAGPRPAAAPLAMAGLAVSPLGLAPAPPAPPPRA